MYATPPYSVMADGHALEALIANLSFREENQNVKFKWLGDFVSLKLFVGSVLKLSGEWKNLTANGGHHFKTNEVSINFYPGTKTLLIQGSRYAKYREILLDYVKSTGQVSSANSTSSAENQNQINETVHLESSSGPLIIPESILEDETSLNYSCSSLSDLEMMIANLRYELNAKVNILEGKIASLNSSSNNHEPSCLMEENIRLREIVHNSLVKTPV